MMNRNWPVVFALRARNVLPPNRSPPPSASTYGARRDRQLLVGHANRCCRRRSLQARAGSRRLRRLGPARSRGSRCGTFGGHLRSVLTFAHSRERGADAVIHRKQCQLGPVGLHRPRVRRARGQVGEIPAHHRPAIARELEFDLAAHHQHGRVAAQMRMTRHGRPGVAGKGRQLVDVARVLAPGDALHHLAADAVELAGVVRQHVHPLLPGELPHHRDGFRAAHFHWVQDLVRHAGERRLREQAARAEQRSIRRGRCRPPSAAVPRNRRRSHSAIGASVCRLLHCPAARSTPRRTSSKRSSGRQEFDVNIRMIRPS